ITVSPEEVEQTIQEVFRFYPNGTPTPTITATPVTFATLSAAQLDLVTATPTLTPTFTRTPGPTATSAPTSAPAPTATPLTQEGFDKLYQDGLAYYAKLGVNEEMFRRIFFEQGLYNERVKAAVTAMGDAAAYILKQTGLKGEDVDLLIPHQANTRIIYATARRVNIPKSKVFVNVQDYGNTSAASIPIALDEARKSGRLKPGDICLMVAFGAGFTWGSVLLRV
ncbi:MAG: hypothetical protein ONB05_06850, partial [candidate division KSB1 bacterium]|nr:hypothetical protein [candidate division KSB1 bacterium]